MRTGDIIDKLKNSYLREKYFSGKNVRMSAFLRTTLDYPRLAEGAIIMPLLLGHSEISEWTLGINSDTPFSGVHVYLFI